MFEYLDVLRIRFSNENPTNLAEYRGMFANASRGIAINNEFMGKLYKETMLDDIGWDDVLQHLFVQTSFEDYFEYIRESDGKLYYANKSNDASMAINRKTQKMVMNVKNGLAYIKLDDINSDTINKAYSVLQKVLSDNIEEKLEITIRNGFVEYKYIDETDKLKIIHFRFKEIANDKPVINISEIKDISLDEKTTGFEVNAIYNDTNYANFKIFKGHTNKNEIYMLLENKFCYNLTDIIAQAKLDRTIRIILKYIELLISDKLYDIEYNRNYEICYNYETNEYGVSEVYTIDEQIRELDVTRVTKELCRGYTYVNIKGVILPLVNITMQCEPDHVNIIHIGKNSIELTGYVVTNAVINFNTATGFDCIKSIIDGTGDGDDYGLCTEEISNMDVLKCTDTEIQFRVLKSFDNPNPKIYSIKKPDN